MIKPLTETRMPDGPEQFEYSYGGNTNFAKAGVAKQLVLILRRYRANKDGTNPTETAPQQQIHLYGLPSSVSTDPVIKAAVDKYNAANEAALQQLVNDLSA